MSCCADPSVHAPHGSCHGNQPAMMGRFTTPPPRRTGMQIAHSAQIDIKHDTTFGHYLHVATDLYKNGVRATNPEEKK